MKSEDGIKGTYQHHKPCGFMLNVVNRIDRTSTPFLYRGEDCMEKFIQQLSEIRSDIFDKMVVNEPMDITHEQEIEFQNSTRCSICNKQFKNGDTKVRDANSSQATFSTLGRKVRDHCHFTGKYRGSAHEKCNLDYCFKHFKVPVFFHNLKNYDAHLIIEKANELNQELNPNKRIKVIAQNSEKQRDYNSRHKDKINEEQIIKYKEDEEYRNRFREQSKKWKSKIILCDICNCSIRQQGCSLHKLTKKHQQNLENQ